MGLAFATQSLFSEAGSWSRGFDLGLTATAHTGFENIDTVTYTQQVPDISLGRDLQASARAVDHFGNGR